MYQAEDEQVVMVTYSTHETTVIATCSNPNWAEHIAALLQADYEEH
jgi:hypothetical protein